MALHGTTTTSGFDPGDQTISYTVETSSVETGLEAVRFLPDTSSSTFDTPEAHAPTSNNYKPRLHDLQYFMDTGDGAGWQFPLRCPVTPPRRHYVGIGGHVFEPGTYDQVGSIVEPSSGKIGRWQNTIVVNHPDTLYPTTQTVCINLNGDSDFTGAPAGSIQHNMGPGETFDQTVSVWTNAVSSGLKTRFLFKGGSTFDVGITNNVSAGMASGLYFGSYGTGLAIWTNSGGDFIQMQNLGSFVGMYVMRVHNIQFQDPSFDPQTDDPSGASFSKKIVDGGGNFDLVVKGCIGSNLASCMGIANSGTDNRIFLDDCNFYNFGGGEYPFLLNAPSATTGAFIVRGCRFKRDPATDINRSSGGGADRIKAVMRINVAAHVFIGTCDFFQTQQAQAALKLQNSPEDGTMTFTYLNVFETAISAPVDFHQNVANTYAGRAANWVSISDVFIPGSGSGNGAALVKSMGATFQSPLVIIPQMNGATGASTDYFIFERAGQAGTNTQPTLGEGAAPIRVLSPTIVCLRTTAENTDAPVASVLRTANGVTNDFSDVSVVDELIHHPNLDTPNTPNTPLESVVMFATENTEGRSSGGGVPDATYLTPAGQAQTFKPQVGSAALGAGTANGSPISMGGSTEAEMRPISRDLGAWQISN